MDGGNFHGFIHAHALPSAYKTST